MNVGSCDGFIRKRFTHAKSVAYNIKEFFFLVSVMGRSSSDEERVFDERRCRSQSFSANEFNIISGSRQRERGTQLR